MFVVLVSDLSAVLHVTWILLLLGGVRCVIRGLMFPECLCVWPWVLRPYGWDEWSYLAEMRVPSRLYTSTETSSFMNCLVSEWIYFVWGVWGISRRFKLSLNHLQYETFSLQSSPYSSEGSHLSLHQSSWLGVGRENGGDWLKNVYNLIFLHFSAFFLWSLCHFCWSQRPACGCRSGKV